MINRIWLCEIDGLLLKGLWSSNREVLETEMIELGVEGEPVSFIRVVDPLPELPKEK